jgi:predicted nucleic acid-binding protein
MSASSPTAILHATGGGTSSPLSDLVLDASVAIKWYVPEVLAAEARQFMAPQFRMHVPSFFAAECGNTIWKKVAQQHELDRDRGREILEELLAYPKQVHEAEGLVIPAYELAHGVANPKLAIYDFVYLLLAVALRKERGHSALLTVVRGFHRTAASIGPAQRRLSPRPGHPDRPRPDRAGRQRVGRAMSGGYRPGAIRAGSTDSDRQHGQEFSSSLMSGARPTAARAAR